MEKVIEYLVSLVVGPDNSLKVELDDQNQTFETYQVHVPKDKIGRVIGKNGSVIRAIRLLASIPAKKDNRQLRIDLIEV